MKNKLKVLTTKIRRILDLQRILYLRILIKASYWNFK